MNNDKLMLALLSNIFGADKAPSVLAICSATPQPTTALEMATGLYEQPDLGYIERKVKNHYEDFVAQRTSFDPLANEPVSYSGQRTKTLYFATEEKAAKYAEAGNNYGTPSSKESNHDHSFEGSHTETVKGCCALSTWLAYEEAR
ncbi:hypothetical protein [Hymenobacter siberiensis]|uniref:hypothetical protein n=1 Tax=Hymenobacter siberiensis TaxID=2848396 RepID=UPI001C1E517E|nr:hypothetical protein [Hymenobacter siberiensis]